jgi:hypothetical protein
VFGSEHADLWSLRRIHTELYSEPKIFSLFELSRPLSWPYFVNVDKRERMFGALDWQEYLVSGADLHGDGAGGIVKRPVCEFQPIFYAMSVCHLQFA